MLAEPRVESHSSLSSYETCPKKYHFRYVQKLRVDRESIEGFVGKRVHEVLERLYRFAQEGRVPSLERVLWRFRQNWLQRYDAERVHIVRDEYTVDFYYRAGTRCLENHYRSHYPFDRDETLGLEKPVRLRLDPQGRYGIRGVIDRLVRARDGAIEIHDFKTGQRVPPQSVLDRDRQLALYEMAVREMLGETGEVRLVWHYLLSNQQRESRRSPEQLRALGEQTRELMDRVRQEREWEPRRGPLCRWCEYRAQCPLFGGAAVPEPTAEELAEVDPALLADQLPLFDEPADPTAPVASEAAAGSAPAS